MFSIEQNSESTYSLRNPLLFVDSAYILRNPKQLAIFACCGIHDTTNVSIKFTLHSYVRGIHRSFVKGIHLYFGTCLKIGFWNPGTYRHKIVGPSQCTVWPRNICWESFLQIQFCWQAHAPQKSACKKSSAGRK